MGGITRNLEIWKPIIAAINRYCLESGLEIALACVIMPIEVINQINRLKGSKTFHLERALRLYAMIMKETV